MFMYCGVQKTVAKQVTTFLNTQRWDVVHTGSNACRLDLLGIRHVDGGKIEVIESGTMLGFDTGV
jgi:hypothetical protein